MKLYASATDDDECGKLYGAAGAAYISCAYIRAQLCENDCQQLEKYNSSRIFFCQLIISRVVLIVDSGRESFN